MDPIQIGVTGSFVERPPVKFYTNMYKSQLQKYTLTIKRSVTVNHVRDLIDMHFTPDSKRRKARLSSCWCHSTALWVEGYFVIGLSS